MGTWGREFKLLSNQGCLQKERMIDKAESLSFRNFFFHHACRLHFMFLGVKVQFSRGSSTWAEKEPFFFVFARPNISQKQNVEIWVNCGRTIFLKKITICPDRRMFFVLKPQFVSSFWLRFCRDKLSHDFDSDLEETDKLSRHFDSLKFCRDKLSTLVSNKRKKIYKAWTHAHHFCMPVLYPLSFHCYWRVEE